MLFLGKCFSCHAGTSANIDPSVKSVKTKKPPKPYVSPIKPKRVEWDQDILDYLINERGYTREYLDKAGIYQCYEYFLKTNGKDEPSNAGKYRGIVWTYRDTAGVAVKYKWRRHDPKGAGKGFGQSKNGKNMIMGIKDVLDNWDKNKTIVLCEGEIDYDTLKMSGIKNAMTPNNGAGSFKEYKNYKWLS